MNCGACLDDRQRQRRRRIVSASGQKCSLQKRRSEETSLRVSRAIRRGAARSSPPFRRHIPEGSQGPQSVDQGICSESVEQYQSVCDYTNYVAGYQGCMCGHVSICAEECGQRHS